MQKANLRLVLYTVGVTEFKELPRDRKGNSTIAVRPEGVTQTILGGKVDEEQEVRACESRGVELIRRVLAAQTSCIDASLHDISAANSDAVSNAANATFHVTRYTRRSSMCSLPGCVRRSAGCTCRPGSKRRDEEAKINLLLIKREYFVLFYLAHSYNTQLRMKTRQQEGGQEHR